MFDTVRNSFGKFSMYQGIIMSLALLIVMSIVYSLTGVMSMSAGGIALSVACLLPATFIANQLFARLFNVAAHTQAWLVTALILVLILPPVNSVERAGLVALTGVIAMATKYLLVWRGVNLFNPAAAGVLIVGIAGLLPVTWWVANPSLLPYMIIIGLVTLFNHRLFGLFAAFAVPSFIILVVSGVTPYAAIASWPLLFLGTIMLTEPTTLPAKHSYRLLYGALVGCIFAAQLHIIRPIETTPELALVIGNLIGFILAPHISRTIKLLRHETPAEGLHELVFTKPQGINYEAGQYADWTAAGLLPDQKGNRRMFSIASSPTESELHIAYRSSDSPFKQYLNGLQPDDSLRVSTVRGSFTLPEASKPLLLIAGGIGITPFRSMAKYVVDKAEPRDIILLYCVRQREDAVFGDVFKQAAAYGWQTKLVVGPLTAEDLMQVSDIAARQIMVSGAPAMVTAVKGLLKAQNVKTRAIRTDAFAGY